MSAPTTRSTLLEAARAILVEEGAGRLTLDAVAQRAGVSKGGLLYHFPSKSALVDGLAEQLLVFTEANLELANRNGVVRTFLETSLPGSDEADYYWAVFSAVRGGLDISDETRALVQRVFSVWTEALRGAIDDPVAADVIRLAGDGLYLSAVLGLTPMDDADTKRVLDRLIADYGQN